jgi:hypothetical protein
LVASSTVKLVFEFVLGLVAARGTGASRSFEAYEAELLVLRRWEEFYEKALGFRPSWGPRRRESPTGEARRDAADR